MGTRAGPEAHAAPETPGGRERRKNGRGVPLVLAQDRLHRDAVVARQAADLAEAGREVETTSGIVARHDPQADAPATGKAAEAAQRRGERPASEAEPLMVAPHRKPADPPDRGIPRIGVDHVEPGSLTGHLDEERPVAGAAPDGGDDLRQRVEEAPDLGGIEVDG